MWSLGNGRRLPSSTPGRSGRSTGRSRRGVVGQARRDRTCTSGLIGRRRPGRRKQQLGLLWQAERMDRLVEVLVVPVGARHHCSGPGAVEISFSSWLKYCSFSMKWCGVLAGLMVSGASQNAWKPDRPRWRRAPASRPAGRTCTPARSRCRPSQGRSRTTGSRRCTAGPRREVVGPLGRQCEIAGLPVLLVRASMNLCRSTFDGLLPGNIEALTASSSRCPERRSAVTAGRIRRRRRGLAGRRGHRRRSGSSSRSASS